MSQENVELASRALDAVNRRDLDAFLALMHDDVEVVTRIAGSCASRSTGTGPKGLEAVGLSD
jgi:hypothetical protein